MKTLRYYWLHRLCAGTRRYGTRKGARSFGHLFAKAYHQPAEQGSLPKGGLANRRRETRLRLLYEMFNWRTLDDEQQCWVDEIVRCYVTGNVLFVLDLI